MEHHLIFCIKTFAFFLLWYFLIVGSMEKKKCCFGPGHQKVFCADSTTRGTFLTDHKAFAVNFKYPLRKLLKYFILGNNRRAI